MYWASSSQYWFLVRECPQHFASCFEFLVSPFPHIYYSYFFPVILWKLHIVNYIVLEAFKRINCTFTSHTIRFHNQIIPFLMVYQSSFNLSTTSIYFFFGTFLRTYLIRCMWRICQLDPRKHSLTTFCIPLCPSETINLAPLKPLSFILSKRSSQNKESSLSVHLTPRVSW